MEPDKSNKPAALTASAQGSLESLSEYTDAHEDTPSAPTEFLAEFLSAIMIKDYERALKYCKLILKYEPYNTTAKELYPLIMEKIQLCGGSSCDESGGEETSADGTTASYSSLEEDEPPELDFNGLNGNDTSLAYDSSSYVDTPSDDASKMLADHVNGNWFPVASSEESSPTEPAGNPLLEPLAHLKI